MKKTTKKLSIKKETVSSFTTLTTQELVLVHGGNDSIFKSYSSCPDCWTSDELV